MLFARNFLVGGARLRQVVYGARTLPRSRRSTRPFELKIVEYKGTGDFLDFEPLCSTYACGVDDEAFAHRARTC